MVWDTSQVNNTFVLFKRRYHANSATVYLLITSFLLTVRTVVQYI